ncbi:hypothetical protein BDV95DRAFT_82084 [Massariosphaeria phaeospora]|uniref:histidine kinase n=1 Tax=Massariosphaeria phaeospora TaxID=100035 RepID=A0A7C8M3Z1_9PLEO|nr:hypothetical protein BDV95DRAFT_82084 [Massariosphaeria phaeospora]
MVSLVDETKQYILAEATRTLSLFSHNADVAEDQIWLGNTILARADAVCHHTFTSSYTARDENGNAYTADCLVVPDCREDPRFADKDYVTSEPGVRFYAGVPITTRLGHQIGVYAVSDDRPRKGMSISDLKFMQDVAATVMEHLELAKDSNDRVKGERMVRGLTDFIERSCSLGSKHETSKKSTTMEKQTENARLEALADEVPAIAATVPAKQPQRKQDSERGVDTSRIFTRAARIIRQSTLADGVVFFDTSAAGISGHVYENCSPLVSSDEDTNQTTTDFDAVDSTATIRRRKKLVKSFRPSTKASSHIDDVESSQHPSGVPLATDTKACPLVAISLQSDDPAPLQSDLSFTEAAMARYILRYPYGKFFNFNEEGTGFNSSDDKSEKSETECSDNHNTEAPSIKRPRKKKSKFTPDELLRIVPNIRSLIFLPLYDPTSENWVAGGFIWSTQPGRLLSPENELPYLRAFGNSITSEISRATAQKSDRAKTTFIASISHELRSPLHGILGSVEFLHDAVSSAYQKTLVSSIETCGKTLLDTIDHVLDYAKINKLRDADSRRKQRPEGRHRRLPGDNSILGVTTDFNLAQLVEEVCETVCAGETFRSTHQLHDGAFHEHVDTAQSNRIQGDASSEPTEPQSRVAVTLRVAPFVNWMVRSQPGAMRRIVMNLLGNSMKYTTSGFITISLLQEEGKSQFVEFTLSVEDSGKGMSSEYQRTKLFAPFSQEDSFSSGTGLGLSIVKQIVDSLNGKIEVQSTVDVGTNAQVVLRLPAGESQNSRASQTLIQAPEALKKKSASTVFPPKSLGGGGQKVKESMRQACEGFGMQTSDTFDLTVAQPDFLLTEPVSLDTILTEQATTKPHMPPLAVICTCTDLTEKRTIESHISRQFAALGWIVEVVTQP